MQYQPAENLRNRTFVGLIVAQFLAGFNDQAIHASAMFYAMHTGIMPQETAITLMPVLFYAPWAICSMTRFVYENTEVNGQKGRLTFDGDGATLLGTYIVGAILTQNTSWTNVERAITALRKEKLLTVNAVERVSQRELARLIRSSGYFRQKARKLKEFVRFLRSQYHGSLTNMFQTPTATLREQLLAIHGIGPETADSILLYAPGYRMKQHLRERLDALHNACKSRHAISFHYTRADGEQRANQGGAGGSQPRTADE